MIEDEEDRVPIDVASSDEDGPSDKDAISIDARILNKCLLLNLGQNKAVRAKDCLQQLPLHIMKPQFLLRLDSVCLRRELRIKINAIFDTNIQVPTTQKNTSL